MTAGPAARVCAILELLRPVATEIIVAVDDRAPAQVAEEIATVADRVIAYPFAEPVDRPLPWLFHLCRGEWMLTLDDDELPSVALLERLPALLEDDRIVHYSIARGWLFPDAGTYLDEPPWRPDYQLRLFRTDPRLIRFSDRLHTPIVPRGPGRFVAEPIWHLDTILRSRDERLAKAHHYERMRPGLRAGGRALNYAFYVPERRPDVRLAPVPADDRTLVELVLAAKAPVAAHDAHIETATRGEIDLHWPDSGLRQSGRIDIVAPPTPFASGEERAIDVVVHNLGDQLWQWGRASLPTVRCAAWWDAEDRSSAIWTPLPSPVGPGESLLVPLHVRAPLQPGRHTLVVDLVQEGVRWFGSDITCEVEVRPRRRVAFLGTTNEDVGEALAADPEVEPVVLTAEPAADGYTQMPSAWPYLAEHAPRGRIGFAATFAFRALRVLVAARSGARLPRDGRLFLDTLASCEQLVVGEDVGETRRERAAVRVAVAAARVLGVRVVES